MAVTEPQVQAAFESTDGFTDPDEARKELVKKLTPLFNDGGGGGAPLDPDLVAIAALEGTGILRREGAASWMLGSETDPTVPSHVKSITEDDIARWDASETDPTVPAHVKSITQQNIVRWNDSLQLAGATGAPLGELALVPGALPPVGTTGTATILGKEYQVCKLPDGKWWMSTNLAWIPGSIPPGGDGSTWWNDGASDDGDGRYYSYGYYCDMSVITAALVAEGSIWRGPEYDDAMALAAALTADVGAANAGNALKSTTEWPSGGGTDKYGFSGEPAGRSWTPYYTEWDHKNDTLWMALFGASDTVRAMRLSDGVGTFEPYSNDNSGMYPMRVSVRLVSDISPLPPEYFLAVPAVSVRLFDTPDFLGDAKVFSIPAQEIAPSTEGVRFYLCAQRSGEVVSLVMVPHDDLAAINGSNITPLWQLEIHDGELHQIGYNNAGDGLPNKQECAQIRTEPYRLAVEGGFAVTLGAGRSLTMDGAEVFFGHRLVEVLPFDSAGDTVHEYAHVSGNYQDTRHDGGWAWPNTHYDNGTNLVEMTNNWYSAIFVWRSIGDDKEIFVVHGGSQANKFEGARLIPIPEVPMTPAWHCMLVGRILFKKGADTGIFEPYARDSFIRVSVPSLSDLSDVSVSGAVEGDALVLGPAGEWIPFADDFRVVEIDYDNALAFGSSTDVFDLASITLPAGTWEVEGSLVVYCVQSGVNPVKTLANIGVISENLPYDGWVQFSGPGEGAQTVSVTVPRRRFEYATPFTVHLCGQELFGTFTDGIAWGNLTARRVK